MFSKTKIATTFFTAAAYAADPITINPMGNRWFTASKNNGFDTTLDTHKEWEWTFPSRVHMENDGIVTHFEEGVPLETGKEYVIKIGWKSGGMATPECPQTDGQYTCYEKPTDMDPILGCYQQVACAANTGDFRVVLADSNTQKIIEDDFGTLDAPLISG